MSTVPTNSIMAIPVQLCSPACVDFVVEAKTANKGLLMGSGNVSGDCGGSSVNFINDSDRYVTLKAGHSCGMAMQLDAILEEVEVRGKLRGRLRLSDWYRLLGNY